jgi:hypothetical protein
MSKNARSPQPAPAGSEQSATLAKLQRLYGHRCVSPDAFGRRLALPSEVERVVKARQPSPPPRAGRR